LLDLLSAVTENKLFFDVSEVKLAPDLSVFASKIPEVNKNWDCLLHWFQEKGEPIKKMQLLYRGTEDKFTAEAFHARCDNSSPPTTLTFVKSEFDRVFGGFASIPWTSSAYNDYSDERAFIFSLSHRTKHEQS
jgi:hypothetical protein